MAISTTAALIIGGTLLAGQVASALLTPTPGVPDPVIPAAPASGAREDTGAQVQLGTDVQDQRISGARKKTSTSKTVDVLGGLGQGGLSV